MKPDHNGIVVHIFFTEHITICVTIPTLFH